MKNLKLKTVLLSYLLAASLASACYDTRKVPPCEPGSSSWPDPCTDRKGHDGGLDAAHEEGGR